jgi:hypothetical protein
VRSITLDGSTPPYEAALAATTRASRRGASPRLRRTIAEKALGLL